MEAESEYYDIYSGEDRDVKCKRQTCDGCLCTAWCPLFHNPF